MNPRTRTMARMTAACAAVLVSFALVNLIATHALPGDGAPRLALAQAGILG